MLIETHPGLEWLINGLDSRNLPIVEGDTYMSNQIKNVIDENHRNFWNIAKGIGILSIVLGHTCWFAEKYVYLYHLALFFFISGYLFSEKKYGDAPFAYVASRLRNLWPRYVFFVSIFALLHNFFLSTGIVINSEVYPLRVMLVNVLNSLLFICSEEMGGSLWFIPVFILSGALFAGTVWFGRFIYNRVLKSKHIQYAVIAVTGLLVGAIGIFLNQNSLFLMYHAHTSFLVVPLFTIAYFVRINIRNFDAVLKWYIALPFAIALWYGATYFGWRVSLSEEMIIGPILFFIVSCSGIYVCLVMAKIILEIPIIRDYFQLIGAYSFEIMACHFLTTKLIDLIYAALIGEQNKVIYGTFVYAYSKECWLWYAIAGTLIPALCAKLFNRVQMTILGSNKKRNLHILVNSKEA